MIHVNAIKVIKRQGIWSFNDKEYGLENVEFCNGADILLNHYAEIDQSIYIMFADQEFPEHNVKSLEFSKSRGEKSYYTFKVFEQGDMYMLSVAFGKPLLHYYDKAPETIYFKIIRENENQKPNPE
jgi:hypothetical protein